MTSTREIYDALESDLNTVETKSSDNADGVLAIVDEQEVGKFFGILRRSGFDYRAKRLGGSLVAAIEADEKDTLADLFR